MMDTALLSRFYGEIRHDFPHLRPRVMILNARRVEAEPGRPLILLHIEDAMRKKLN